MLQVINQKFLISYFQTIIQLSRNNAIEYPEFNTKYSKISLNKFTIHLFNLLDFSDDLAIFALTLAKQVIKSNIKIHKKCVHRLIAICGILTCKVNFEDQYALEFYSLMSGITIKDLAQLQLIILEILDFKCLVDQKWIFEVKQSQNMFITSKRNIQQ